MEGYRKLESRPGQQEWTRRALDDLVELHRARNEPEKAAMYRSLLERRE